MPYCNPFGMIYDSGAYHQVMERVLGLGEWSGFGARRAAARQRGRYRGIGVANYVDTATGVPRERAEVTVRPEGAVEVVIGTVSSGQGHETSFPQLVGEWLGVPIECVSLITGDTDRVSVGGGSHSGRALRLGSIVMLSASNQIIEKGMRIASHVLEVAAADLEFSGGRFTVKGTDRHWNFRSRRGCVAAQRPAGRSARRTRRGRRQDHAASCVSLRLPCLRSGSRSGHGRRSHRTLFGSGRCRACGQSDDRAWPGARRHHARHWPGTAGAVLLRSAVRTASIGFIHGLRDRPRRRRAILRLGTQRGAVADASARESARPAKAARRRRWGQWSTPSSMRWRISA